MQPAALSIAGSDSGGGAGIQVDLRVMRRLGVTGTTAITAVTAQNLEGVTMVDGVRPALVLAQIDAVLAGFDVRAIKTGMLWSAEIIEAVADRLRRQDQPIVVDPVMVATSGARLLAADAVDAYAGLWSQAALATPNLDEAEILLGEGVSHEDLPAAAQRLRDRLGCAVLLKGGHVQGAPVDVLASADATTAWRHERITDVNTHGTGCMLASAIAARLALGDRLVAACAAGLAFVHDALRRGAPALASVETAEVEPSHLREAIVHR